MTTFNWKIESMPAYPQAAGEKNVVFQVNWRCSAQDETYNAVSVGSVPVTYAVGTPYTPYADLTEEQVWGWINPSIDRTEIETNLQAMIDAQKTSAVVTPPLPWSQA